MDFGRVLTDLADLEDERADLRDRHAELKFEVKCAVVRLARAELDKDRRQWTQDEAEELEVAEIRYDEAVKELVEFEKQHYGELT
jgi:hypothetical protein